MNRKTRKKILKSIKDMTTEEYCEIYEAAMKDIKESPVMDRLKSVSQLMDEQAAELDAEIRAGRIPADMSRKNVRYWKRYMKKRAKTKKKEKANDPT